MGPLVVAFVGLADAKGPKPCWVPTRFSYTGRSSLTYIPVDQARAREAEIARLERRQPREIRAGWLSLELDRVTLGAADPSTQLVTVLHDGHELLRYEPESEIPEQNPRVVGYWYSYAVVQLPEGTAPPFDVEVTDRLLAAKCTWTVDPAGAAVLHPRKEDEGSEDSAALAPDPTPDADEPR